MSLVNVAVKRPVTVWMFTFAILLFGFVSLSRLAINLLPELSYPTLTIRTDYTGAAPGEVEQLVSKPIEEAVGVVKGVRRVESTSKADQSDVVLEFEWGTDMDLASLEVREKLDVLQLPLDVKRPVLLRFNPNLDPVLRFGLGMKISSKDSHNQLSIQQMKALRTYADEQVKRKLESVNGVASVKLGGGLENEVQVLFDQQKVSQLNIKVEDIVNRIKAENVNAAGGRVEDGTQQYLVRTLNQFKTLDEMRDMFIATRDGRNIRLGDIATIKDAYKERDSITRFKGMEGVEIAIYKEGDANTVQVAKNVSQALANIKKELPKGYQIQMVYDQSRFISSAISQVKSAGIMGGILAMLVLFLFLKNIWPTLIISVSIPVSIIATFNLMYGYNISLNIMSLGGIALAIGMLVDNSIVVLENIDRLKKQGKPIRDAAEQGTKKVATAIIASTLTTMAVFFPLVFVQGVAGQLFADQALTVTFALGASLLAALTIIPMMASREKTVSTQPVDDLDLPMDPVTAPTTRAGKIMQVITWIPRKIFWLIGQAIYYISFTISSLIVIITRLLRKGLGGAFKPVLWGFDRIYNVVERLYEHGLNYALRHRVGVLACIVLLALGSLLLIPRLGMELIPRMSQGEFYVEVTLPTGTKLQNTDAVLKDLALFTQKQPEVLRTYSLAGTGSLMNASPTQGGDYWGKLNVVLKPGSTPADEQHTMEKLRQYLHNKPGVTAKFGTPALFSFSTPLEIDIAGYDLDSLRLAANKVAALMNENDRFADVKTNMQSGNPELRIIFNHARLAQLGLSAPDVAKLVAAKVGGDVASKFTINDRKVDILVRTEASQRDSINDIKQMIINPGSSHAVPLNAVADLRMSVGPSQITRIGQQRVAVVSANLAYGDLGEAALEARQIVDKARLPMNVHARIAGQNEEMKVSFDSLKFALGLAIFLVYLVMASQFESLLHPFLILFTVPLACAGSIYGLFITGTSISVVVFIGLIMLAGIVVNNAIVLIDRINQLREEGVGKVAAIMQSAESRLRPILMTTLTTTLGLLPMAFGVGEGAEMRTPMAITVIFGLLFATMLTLFLIPILYSLFDRKTFKQEVQHG